MQRIEAWVAVRNWRMRARNRTPRSRQNGKLVVEYKFTELKKENPNSGLTCPLPIITQITRGALECPLGCRHECLLLDLDIRPLHKMGPMAQIHGRTDCFWHCKPPGELVAVSAAWKALSAVACIASVSHPIFFSSERLKRISGLVATWKEVYTNYDLLWEQDSELCATESWNRFEATKRREGSIDETSLPKKNKLILEAYERVCRKRGLDVRQKKPKPPQPKPHPSRDRRDDVIKVERPQDWPPPPPKKKTTK